MSINPGTYNIELYRRSDWSQEFVLKDSGGSAVDLSTYTVEAQSWSKDRGKKYLDITCTITNAATGSIKLSLNDTQTASLPDLSYWDLRLTASNISDFWLTGTITAKEGYTA